MAVKNYYPILAGSWRATGAIIPTFFAIIPTFFSMTALALACVCLLAAPSLAMPAGPLRFRPGLRNSPEPDKLSGEQLDILVKSLREKTGFFEMRFDENGFLALGDRTRIAGGSATARALLVATVDGTKAILLKNRRRSSEVAFARLAVSAIYEDVPTEARIEAYPLELDFSDFAQLQGHQEVIAAFDPGFATLHELAHAVLALEDDQASAQGLGHCEMYINRIRRELGLPERQHYYPQVRKTARYGGTVKIREMIFVQQEQTKARRFYLRWETDQVGRIVERARPADSHKGAASLIAKQ